MASYDPKKLPPSDYRLDFDEMAAYGLIPGTDAPDFFATAFDPREDFDPVDAVDLGWARETVRGIELRRHPETALLDYPALWSVVLLWSTGALREPSRVEVEAMSNFELECVFILSAASGREERRRLNMSTDVVEE